MIDRNIRNLKKLAPLYPQRHQLFLGFLAGINPGVVVPSAKQNLPEVVNKLVFPFLVNAGQDCMNSDVVFVHNDVSHELVDALKGKFSLLKQTSNTSLETGISPVTMSKNFDKLLTYRQKYEKYLVTPEARINSETKQVEPHLFVIPFSEFSNLDLQEHFAPFMTLVTYDRNEDLKQAAQDPRMSKKAMYALIYGDKQMSSDLEKARDVFRQTQHMVLTNTHLYEEFEMNMPFGGIGTDTSMSVLVQLKGDGNVQVYNRNRPVLISKEVEESSSVTVDGPVLASPTDSDRFNDTDQVVFAPIREEAQKNGLYLYSANPSMRYASSGVKRLYGIPLAIPETGNIYSLGHTKSLKGVVLHATDIENVGVEPTVIGTLNPMLGDQAALRQLNGSKLEEFLVTRQVDASLMPNTKLFFEVVEGGKMRAFEAQRNELLTQILTLSDKSSVKEREDVEFHLTQFVSKWLNEIRVLYPRGAYLKNYGEYGSGDLGNAVTTFNAPPKQIAKEFMLFFNEAITTFMRAKFTDKVIQDYLYTRSYANSTRFVRKLLLEPQSLLVQERLPMAQTAHGVPLEFRVDFIAGTPVFSRIRFGYEFYPDFLEKSKEVVREFFAKAPPEIKNQTGGADVGFTIDGKPVVFEWNFGTASGTFEPGYYPFEANEIFSRLQGKDTWLMAAANTLATKTAQEQNEFLRKVKNERPPWWRNEVSDISQVEWASWLRNEMLKKWRLQPNKKELVEQLQYQLQQLLDGLGTSGNLDFVRLYEDADLFIKQELGRTK